MPDGSPRLPRSMSSRQPGTCRTAAEHALAFLLGAVRGPPSDSRQAARSGRRQRSRSSSHFATDRFSADIPMREPLLRGREPRSARRPSPSANAIVSHGTRDIGCVVHHDQVAVLLPRQHCPHLFAESSSSASFVPSARQLVDARLDERRCMSGSKLAVGHLCTPGHHRRLRTRRSASTNARRSCRCAAAPAARSGTPGPAASAGPAARAASSEGRSVPRRR